MTDREPPEPIQIRPGEKRLVPTPPPPSEPPASPKSIPRKKIGERLAAVPNSIPWKKIIEGLAAARSAVLNVLLLVSLFALIGLAVAELRRDVVVIDPIRLPEPLRKMGYSEDVAAHRLWDEVVRINESTPTAKDRVALQPASQQMDFKPPGAGVSLQEVVQMLRPFLGLEETRIAGEFICMTEECKPEGLILRLRVFRGGGMKIISIHPVGDQPNEAETGQNFFGSGMKIITLPQIDDQTNEAKIDRYFRAAALDILREIDPYLVAFYLYQTDKAAAESEALRLIAPTHPQRKWALNLLGFIAADRGDHDDAIDWYRRATEADEGDEFAIAYNNWGVALRAQGDPDAAIVKFKRVIELDPENAFTYSNWGDALSDQGYPYGAMAKYARATELDPESTFAYNKWGNSLYEQGDLDGAIAKYKRATEVDPKDALAYFNWGIALGDKDEFAGAITKYTRVIELDPEDAGAYTNWGIALYNKTDFEGAIVKFELAAKLDPNNASIYNYWGGALGAMNEMEEALAKFTRATEFDPKYANGHLNMASVLELLERAGDAADAYQRFLDLSPDSRDAEWIRLLIEELRAKAAND